MPSAGGVWGHTDKTCTAAGGSKLGWLSAVGEEADVDPGVVPPGRAEPVPTECTNLQRLSRGGRSFPRQESARGGVSQEGHELSFGA